MTLSGFSVSFQRILVAQELFLRGRNGDIGNTFIVNKSVTYVGELDLESSQGVSPNVIKLKKISHKEIAENR